MLTSFAYIFLLGILLGEIMKKLRLPALLGYLISGMILGPNALNLLNDNLLNIAADLRQIALVVILTRAGLALDIKALKKVGRPAILMCFLPACFEIAGAVIIGPKLLGISANEALVLGSVLAAVSPAVIVPRMIKLIDEGYGKEHSIPELILAGASVDDVFVIVIFTASTGLLLNGSVSAGSFLRIPVSIILGIILGIIVGFALVFLFKKLHMRDTVKMLIMVSISFLCIELQNRLEDIVPVSGLLAIMSMGIVVKLKYNDLAVRLSQKYNKVWVAAEVLLFVLVGAAVDLKYAVAAGAVGVLVVIGALVFRIIGVRICLIKTKLTRKEKSFCMIAYTPKATVQAAIGAVPLSMGLACGNVVLTVAVLSILITAPIGAILIDNLYKKLLKKE